MRPRFLRGKKLRSVPEQAVVSKTVSAAKKAGFIHRKIKYVNHNGAPDDWFFGYDGTLIIIEFKAPNKEPEEHQGLEISRLRRRGFEVHVIDSIEQGVALFKDRGQF